MIMSNDESHDYSVNKIILNILSAFAMNDDLNILIRTNWLEGLLKILINYTFKIRSIGIKDSSDDLQSEPNMIIVNQTLIVRILRLIFSLEKNRKYFKQLFPTKILGIFIEIGNYKHSLNLYNQLITEFNSLADEELNGILQKSENITSETNYMNQTVGGYTIIDLIGKGGFGSVFKVKIGNQNFAMKEIKIDQKEISKFMGDVSTQNLEKLIKEIDIWKELDHPNIIKYYTSFMEKEKSHVYIIMELINGVNITEYIKNFKEKGSKPKEKDVIRIIIDIIAVMKYLHKEKGILYRDLNPRNIMLDESFIIKMGDFGLAKKLNETNFSDREKNNFSHSMSNNFVGSILYSSPEMIKNQEYTEKSDLWSFGCIIYELITLSPPFEGDNPLTVAKNIVELNYKKLNKEDYENPILVTIIERCLNLNIQSRCDIEEICGYLAPYLIDKLNYYKKIEYDIKNENEILNDKILKLETAFSLSQKNTNLTWTAENLNTPDINSKNNLNSLESKTDIFKQSNFKPISDPLSKILDILSKIMFLSSESNIRDNKDEKCTIVMKFKRKIFPANKILNPKIIKNEMIKLLNFSKEQIIFESDDKIEPFNSTGMKTEPYTGKLRITYEMLFHIIEELLIVNKYYTNSK
jgi:serine/threonine protein kinase